MRKIFTAFRTQWQLILYLFVNILFIFKYLTRTEISVPLITVLYISGILGFVYLYFKWSPKVSEKLFKYSSFVLLSITLILIAVGLLYIDPYTVRVDRWSAVSFFLEGLFNGEYPYGIHTHVSETNFPSPFPLWHVINIPFYLLGDVGIGLIFFLIITFVTVKIYFNSYRKAFFFLILLILSPAYWWEVAVRSDSLSNGFLVLTFILWYTKKGYSVDKNFWLTIILCGIIASTRLSAVLPVALFLFAQYIQTNWLKKILFPLSILAFVLVVFMPFVLWTIDGTYVFFTRNPFMSQTSVGNPVFLIIMIVAGIIFALKWKNTDEYFEYAASFMFIFMAGSQLSLIMTRGISGSFFTDSTYDLSYFTLYLPYTLMALASKVSNK
ncbi:MAG: hypothetical protein RBT49_18160 [Bacteroidales bacterium]|jgi:hypothetical protein|nr:hypothetical protein [Bacteroidales bacterium]